MIALLPNEIKMLRLIKLCASPKNTYTPSSTDKVGFLSFVNLSFHEASKVFESLVWKKYIKYSKYHFKISILK